VLINIYGVSGIRYSWALAWSVCCILMAAACAQAAFAWQAYRVWGTPCWYPFYS
jgi:hypothetical protein